MSEGREYNSNAQLFCNLSVSTRHSKTAAGSCAQSRVDQPTVLGLVPGVRHKLDFRLLCEIKYLLQAGGNQVVRESEEKIAQPIAASEAPIHHAAIAAI